MGYVGYQTPISQDDYLIVGVVSAVIGFLFLAYFFMYLLLYSATKLHSKSIKEK
jgi:quinol-cytochrome oxidoreductase complex cytochrome b subunit